MAISNQRRVKSYGKESCMGHSASFHTKLLKSKRICKIKENENGMPLRYTNLERAKTFQKLKRNKN